MFILLAHNVTGTKPDGTSDYDVEVRINEYQIAKFQVNNHIRENGGAELLRALQKFRKTHQDIERRFGYNE